MWIENGHCRRPPPKPDGRFSRNRLSGSWRRFVVMLGGRAIACPTVGGAERAAGGEGTAGVGHRFARADDTQGKVFIVSREGAVEWEYAAPNGNGAGGTRVFGANVGGQMVWGVRGDELPGISLKFMAGLHRLANGNTVMSNWLGHGQFGKAPHLIEVTRDKQVVWTFADHERMKTVSSVVVLDDAPGSGRVWH